MSSCKTHPKSYRLGSPDREAPTISYVVLPNSSHPCIRACRMCYLRTSPSFENRKKVSEEESIEEILLLRERGYKVIIEHTELLAYDNYLKLASMMDVHSVFTNGSRIARNPELVEELVTKAGVKHILITGSIDRFSAGFGLVPERQVVQAIKHIVAFQSKHPWLELVVNFQVNHVNFRFLNEIVDFFGNLGVRVIRIFPTLLQDAEVSKYWLTPDERRQLFSQVAALRKAYEWNEERGTGIRILVHGSYGLRDRPSAHIPPEICKAGRGSFTIGPDRRIYPCVFLMFPENELGEFTNGELQIRRNWDVESIDPLECPAAHFLIQRFPRQATAH